MRSITVGLPIWDESTTLLSTDLARFFRHADTVLKKKNIQTRTTRLMLPTVPMDLIPQPSAVRSALRTVKQLASESNIRWYCLPVDLTADMDYQVFLEEMLDELVKNQNLFIHLIVGDDKKISITAAYLAAEFVLNLSRRSYNGFDNFRVGVSCACRPNTPFFPFSRYEGSSLGFSLALETTLPSIESLQSITPENRTLDFMRATLKNNLKKIIIEANNFGLELEQESKVDYKGLDASYAPFPDGETSVATLVECFGVSPFGTNGTLFVTSILTDTLKAALKEANARCVGFNGVMYSVLEDKKLASSNNQAKLGLDKLTLFSTLCGCGIDMAPIPATAYIEDVAAIILDVAALAVRLSKPLGVRMIPIPNKMLNEFTSFNLDFLCDSRVMDSGVSDTTISRKNTELWHYLN
jgi:uncharacterized protein (UPF0210 family)